MNRPTPLRRGVVVALLSLTVVAAGWFSFRSASPRAAESRKGQPTASAPGTSRSSAITSPAPDERTANPAEPPPSGTSPAPIAIDSLPQPAPATASGQFFGWLRGYLVASTADRPALIAEGQRLAQARRMEFKQLISEDPRKALEEAVPMVARQRLPAEIVDQLESRVSGIGRLEVLAVSPGSDPAEPVVRRFATLDGQELRAHVYGARERQMSTEKAMMNGVAVDQQLALSDSPVRPLEVGEIPDSKKEVVEKCPVSGLSTKVARKSEETLPPVTPETPAVEAGDQIIYLCDGGHVRQLVQEILLEEGATGGPTAPTSTLPQTRQNSTGVRRCIYMRVIFPDRLQEPQTERDAWTNARQLDEYFKENSYGKLAYQTTVTPVLVLPRTEAWYINDYNTTTSNTPIMTDAKEAARAAGFPPEDYHHFTVIYTGGPGSFGGLGSVNGSNAWLKTTAIGTFRHEIGHNLGVWHSNFWNTGGTSSIGPGANEEYGHHNDVMGSSGSGGHFNASMKEQLQWITPETYHTVLQSGTYRIFQFDQVNQDPTRRFAIKVAKDVDRDYWIEFRQKLSTNPWYTSGASINWGPWGRAESDTTNQGSNSGTQLLDMTPGSPDDKNDSPLVIGRTFSDPSADVHITPIAKGATTPESLDVVVNVGTSGANSPPTLTIGASATTIAVGGTVNFTATATDPNGDPLAYYWTFGDKLASFNGPSFSTNNSATQSKTFSTAGWYAVQCTVSDMKGGATRKTVLVQVGTPTTFYLSGTVTDAGSGPVFDARVHNGQTAANFRGCYTDSDGYYVVTNLAAGTVTLAATQAGTVFAPTFVNPATVGPDQTGLNFTASEGTRVSMQALDATANESGDTASFRLTRTGSTASALTVYVDFSGSASTGDYTLNPVAATTASPLESFTIPAGASQLDVTLTATQDSTQEGPEKLVISLINAGNAYLPTGPQLLTLTIDDDDTTKPRISLTVADPEATEGADNAQFIVTRTGGSIAAPLVVNFTNDATVTANAVAPYATAGVDYAAIGTSIEIPALASSVAINIVPVNDALVEGMELVKLTLASNANYILDTAITGTVKINDDDIATVTVTATDTSLNENGDTGAFTVSRTRDVSAPLTVQYSMTGDALHGTDYQALPCMVTIPAGQTSAIVRIVPIQDSHGEPSQSVVLQLASAPQYRVAAPSSASITLVDDGDTPVVAVSLTDGVASEGASPDTGTFTIITTGTGTGNITVNYQITGTATSGEDFTALPGTLSIGKNTTATITVTPLNDSIPEDVETVTLTILPNLNYQVDLRNSATLAIRDDDAVNMVSVSASVTSVSEGGTGRFYFSRTGSTTSALVIPYTMGGTADGSDYTPLPGTVTIPAAASGAYVDVVTNNDAAPEGTETIELTISPDTGEPRTYGVQVAKATIPVVDADPGFTNTLSLSPAGGSVLESTSFVGFPVTRTGAGVAGSTCTVDYSVRYATAQGSGVDFIMPPGRLTFGPGETEKSILLQVIDDNVPEGVEAVIVQLTNPGGAQISTNGARSTLFIKDDEPRVFIEAVDPFATEGGDTAQFRVTRRGRTAGTLTVPIAVSGTATSGTDFTALPASVTIPGNAASTTFNLTALSDAATEGPETVIVSLAPSAAILPGNQTSATVRIADAQSNDPPFLHLVSPRGNGIGVPTNVWLNLDVLATDDVPASLTTTWSQVSGPGTVTFENPATASTRAQFTTPGAYVVRLTASDGTQTATLDVSLTAGGAVQPWTNADIGSTITYPGAVSEQFGQVAMASAGLSPTGTSDTLFFRGRTLTGDGEIVARVQHLVNTSASARVGVMIRESSAPGARMATMLIAPAAMFSTNVTSFHYRATSTVSTVTTAGIAPAWWLRVTRSGNVFTAYDSPDGTTWTPRGTPQTLSFGSSAQIGLALTSASNSEVTVGILDNVRVTGVIENNAPVANAGADVTASVGAMKHLPGTATDDSLPGDPGVVQGSWSVVSGPGSVLFSAPSSIASGVMVSAPGTYFLRLTVDDGEIRTSDDVTLVATTSTITVNATTPTASEQGLVPGVFTVTRTGSSGDLPVDIARSGTATNAVDYAFLGTQIFIPDGSTSAEVVITPLADMTAEGPETVVLTLPANPNYILGSPASASITLNDLAIDQWRFEHFGAAANDPQTAGLTANPDGDGMINLLEYAFGTPPMTGNPLPVTSDIVTIGPDRFLRLTIPKNPNAIGLTYQAEATGNLGQPSSWSSAGLTIEVDDATMLRVRDNTPLGSGALLQRFLRGVVTQP